ncbi:MAG: PAC2 family protein [Aigarchaeota archaeon]|nr:PAC2 family protein [Candidatus Pelearchaeum maunauluense]
MSDDLRLFLEPELREPYMVVGFHGWPNGGEVSSGVLTYLITRLGAGKLGEIAPSRFYDFTSKRPQVRYRDGVLRSYEMPRNEFYYAEQAVGRGLILFLGHEPNLNWMDYVEAILHVVERFRVVRVFTVGGLLDRVPHTVEPLVSFATNSERVLDRLRMLDLEPTDYEGPSSVHSLILYRCRELGVEAISLWGHSPYYLSGADLQTIYHVARRLLELMEVSLDLHDLKLQSEAYRERLDAEMSSNHELRRLVAELEGEYQLSRRRPDYVS